LPVRQLLGRAPPIEMLSIRPQATDLSRRTSGWKVPPFAPNSLPPFAALHFDHLQIDRLCQPINNGGTEGSQPAVPGASGPESTWYRPDAPKQTLGFTAVLIASSQLRCPCHFKSDSFSRHCSTREQCCCF